MGYTGARVGRAVGQGLTGFGAAIQNIAEEDRRAQQFDELLDFRREDAARDSKTAAQREAEQLAREIERQRQGFVRGGWQEATTDSVVPEGAQTYALPAAPKAGFEGSTFYRTPDTPTRFDPATDVPTQREEYFRLRGLGRYGPEAPEPVRGMADAQAGVAAQAAIKAFGSIDQAIEQYQRHAQLTEQAPDDQMTLRELLRLKETMGRRELLGIGQDDGINYDDY